MVGLTDKTKEAESITHNAVVLGLTYTLTPEEKSNKLRHDINRYEERYGAFDGRSNPQVARILGGID